MMRRTFSFLLPICFSVLALAPAAAADRFELLDGDRVILLGSTLIEREQRYGYWETLLTLRYPGRRIQFRNLGWSGDTVFGDARAGFGLPADGFRHLKEHVLAIQPSVILLSYGLNESFAGKAGVPRFLEGLRVLLDASRSAHNQGECRDYSARKCQGALYRGGLCQLVWPRISET